MEFANVDVNTQTELLSTLKVAFSYSLPIRNLLYTRLDLILERSFMEMNSGLEVRVSKQSLSQLQSTFFEKFASFFETFDDLGQVCF